MTGLVAGHFGEISKGFDTLLHRAAETGAARLQRALYQKTPERAKAVLLYQLRRKIAAAICRANLDCLAGRMQHLGGLAAQAKRNRDDSRRRFFTYGDPSHASYEYRRAYPHHPNDVGAW